MRVQFSFCEDTAEVRLIPETPTERQLISLAFCDKPELRLKPTTDESVAISVCHE